MTADEKSPELNPTRRGRWLAAAAGAAIGVVLAVGIGAKVLVPPNEPVDLTDAPLDGQRAYGYLVEVCQFGPRPSGSEALKRLRDRVAEHFRSQGAQVELQPFTAKHPLTGAAVEMANVIARWNPETRDRILLAAHYDTRPHADLDPDPVKRQNAPFVGANDGGSGTALFMELAHHLNGLDTPRGVDLVLFDGEELVFDERGEYFLGSTHFAREYRRRRPAFRYSAGVVVDMIGDRDLAIYQEGASRKLVPQLTDQIWRTAESLGVRSFVPRVGYDVRDDHLPLNTIADIQTCLVIDFEYPDWHTAADTPDKCSAESLVQVGWVLLEWLQQPPEARRKR